MAAAMIGRRGAATARPTAAPITSIRRLVIRTLHRMDRNSGLVSTKKGCKARRHESSSFGKVTSPVDITAPQPSVIRLTLPADLRFRDLAVRAVAEACRLVSQPRTPYKAGSSPVTPPSVPPASSQTIDLSDHFTAEMVSAVSEIFNNIAIHGYERQGSGDVTIEMTLSGDHLLVQISDFGTSFDMSQVPAPELDTLPEGGMGIHIAKACVDELDYTPGPPNVWRIKKYCGGTRRSRDQPL